MTGPDAYGGVFQISVRGQEPIVNEDDCDCGDLNSVSHISVAMNAFTLFYLYRLVVFARAFLLAESATVDIEKRSSLTKSSPTTIAQSICPLRTHWTAVKRAD
jgi:hypothetical protein